MPRSTASDLPRPLPPADVMAGFRATVLDHYRIHSRPLPWRQTWDPYAILVSEIMLQQTQVERVKTKYAEFLALFPDIASLADAGLHEVLTAWQGLGYNRRAVALHRCAGTVMKHHEGRMPATIEELEALPGIGAYTARAIAAFAFGIASPFIETNIRTVFIHHFFPESLAIRDRDILPLVAATLDPHDIRTWYYALMDYGVMLKRQHGNPGKRSAHHARQSPFRGSNRELRSRILKALLNMPCLSAVELTYCLGANEEAVGRNLSQMTKEGLLRESDGRYLAG